MDLMQESREMADVQINARNYETLMPKSAATGERSSSRANEAQNLSSPATRFAIGFLIVILCSLAAWPFLPRRYESTVTLILRATDETGPSSHGQALKQLLDEGAVQSELDVMSSLPLSAAVMERLSLNTDPEFSKPSGTIFNRASASTIEPVREIQNHLVVSRDRKSYTVRLGYWSNDPAKSVRMADALASAYLDRQVQHKLNNSEQLIERLRSRLVELATREAELRRVVDNNPEASFKTAELSDERAATSIEFAGIRQKLVDATQHHNEIGPDAERVADAVMPINPTFPNPLLMAIATLLLASLVGFAFAWPVLRLRLANNVATIDGTEAAK